MTQTPSPPASVTPASVSAGSWSMVAASAASAASTARAITGAQPRPAPRAGMVSAACIASVAASRSTVSMVPSWGLLTAW